MAKKKQSFTPPPKTIKAESRVFLSMLYEVKDQLEIKSWMKAQDIFQAHPLLIEKIQDVMVRLWDGHYCSGVVKYD